MIPLTTAKVDLAVNADHTEHPFGESLDTLGALHNRIADALAGYAKMVEKAEPSFRSTAQGFHALHAAQDDRLARMIGGLGGDADADGTLTGTVNVAAVSLRAMFDTIDVDVLDNIRNGEDSVMGAFDEAIAASGDEAMRTELSRMRDDLTALVDRLGRSDRTAAI